MAVEERDFGFLEEGEDDGYQSRSSMRYQENVSIPTKQQWMTDLDENQFKILDPDDPLMKRFQDALKSHLLRINNKLSDEISELVRYIIYLYTLNLFLLLR